MMQVKLTNAPHLSRYFDKNSEDTQQLLISWEPKSSRTSCYTVLRALSFKNIKILIILPLQNVIILSLSNKFAQNE
jgi:hypothetical protein